MPTRYLKPGIRDSDLIDKLSPLAECLFYRLLVTVDDYGRADARPTMIKAQCFPIKDSITANKCDTLLAELAEAALVSVYAVEGKTYLQMLKWENVPRSATSKFPEMPAGEGERMHLHTDARNPRAVLPVTGTVTGTETETGKRPVKPAAPPGIHKPESVSDQTWQDWLSLRKGKKAPVTKTVLDGAIREAAKASMSVDDFLRVWCFRGSQGFQASWIKPEDRAQLAEGSADWRASWKTIVEKGVSIGCGSWSQTEWEQGRATDFPTYRAKVEKRIREMEGGQHEKRLGMGAA